MAQDSYIKALAQQQGVPVTSDGVQAGLRMTRTGSLYTAGDWKTDYVLRGLAYNVTIGSVAAGGDVAMITGGGNGTVIDSDQPEMFIQTPANYFHVPLSFKCAVQADLGAADLDEANIILFGDLSHTMISAPTATVETPQNLLDGSGSSVSNAYSAVTADLTDPTCDLLFDFATVQAAEVAADGTINTILRMDFEPVFPFFLQGPCAVVACWGGTAAAVGMASYCWAEIPIAQVS